MAVAMADSGLGGAAHLPARSTLAGLSWLNFLVSMMQTGFGSFVAVNLLSARWTNTEVGLALSVASMAGIVAQVPAGAMVDLIARKRLAVGLAIVAISLAALIIATWQSHAVVMGAMAVQGGASAVLTPAIAALSLALVPHEGFADRLGLNVRYAALGTALAAGAMGIVGAEVSNQLSLILAGVFGFLALGALRSIRGADLGRAHEITDHMAVLPRAVRLPWAEMLAIARNRNLAVFGLCLMLFQLGNAGLLPLAIGGVVRQDAHMATLVVAAAVIVSQALTAGLSLPLGRMARLRGRRPVLLLGLAAMSLKAVLFAFDGNPLLIVLYQSVDAVSGAAIGVIVPLVVADITRRSGHFNLAMGLVGFTVSVGAMFGTTMAGTLADRFGVTLAFGVLATIGGLATALAWVALPEFAERGKRGAV